MNYSSLNFALGETIDMLREQLQAFVAAEIAPRAEAIDQENLFHAKMMLKDFALENYIFGAGVDSINAEEQRAIAKKVKREMREIFYGRNLPDLA